MHRTTRRPSGPSPTALARSRPDLASAPSDRRRAGPRAAGLAVTAALLFLVASSCALGGGEQRASSTTSTRVSAGVAELAIGVNATVPATLPVPANFVPADTRGVLIPPVLSRPKRGATPDPTKPTLPVVGGTAKIEGRVLGPDGPVEGATVRLERFVGSEFGVYDVGTNKDGKYVADGLLGGRFRVRAWQKPSLATLEPPALFLAADRGTGVLDITTEKREGVALQGALNTAEPRVGERNTFQALLYREEVDDNGIVVGTGIDATDVQLTPIGGLKLFSPEVTRTGPDGFALFTIMCTVTGSHSVIIGSGVLALAVGLPPCLDGTVSLDDIFGRASTTRPPAPPAPSTTITPPTTGPRPSTTTTSPPRPTTTRGPNTGANR